MPRLPPPRLFIAAWIPLIVIYTALFMGSGASAPAASRGALVSVLPFLLLGFVALRVPWLVPWRDGRRAAFFTAQLALTAAYAVVGTAGLTVLWNLDALLFSGRPVGFDPLRAAWQAFAGGMIYLVIAGGAYAWQNDQRVREEAARAARAEALRTKAELAALRSQLNPHFLLNTLHAALGLVRRDPPLAERALERLGEVLHYGLRMHRESLDQVPLADEWSFVKSYLEIESLRLEERLRLSLEAEPEALMERVPPFVLQPLVENAIRHAVAPRKDGGRVAVSVRRRGDRLLLEVSDDGPGMPSASPGSGAGVGLRLLRERLALLYAGRASLSVQAAEASGVRATIELPLDREPATEPV